MKKFILDFLSEEEGLATVEFAAAGFLLAPTVITAFTLSWHLSWNFY